MSLNTLLARVLDDLEATPGAFCAGPSRPRSPPLPFHVRLNPDPPPPHCKQSNISRSFWTRERCKLFLRPKVGDNLFVHGGLLPEHLRSAAEDADQAMENLNKAACSWLLGEAPMPEAIWGENSPVWTRLYSSPESRDVDDVARAQLEEVGGLRLRLELPQMEISWNLISRLERRRLFVGGARGCRGTTSRGRCGNLARMHKSVWGASAPVNCTSTGGVSGELLPLPPLYFALLSVRTIVCFDIPQSRCCG